MKQLEGIFENSQQLKIYYRGWLPEDEPKAVLAIVHGLAEHSGRYGDTAGYFVSRGYAVYGLDHQGHGKSPGQRCYVDSFSRYTEDLAAFLEIVRSRHPEKPLFLLGHSVGATISAAFLCRQPEGVKGFVSSAISLKTGKGISPLHIAIARLLSRISPRLQISRLSSATISSDRKVVKAYDKDPLVYRGKISARGGSELIKAMGQLTKDLSKLSVPLLVLHGEADRLIDPQSSRLLYEGAGCDDKTLKMYPDFYHEILNEPDRQQVLQDIADWLEARLADYMWSH